MLRLAFDFIITWRETRTRPNAYSAGIVMASRIIATSTKTLVTQFYHYIFPHFTFL